MSQRAADPPIPIKTYTPAAHDLEHDSAEAARGLARPIPNTRSTSRSTGLPAAHHRDHSFHFIVISHYTIVIAHFAIVISHYGG